MNKPLNPYRFIRYIRKISRGNAGEAKDHIKVFFDIDEGPRIYYSHPEDFLKFLHENHNLESEHPSLLVKIKSSLNVYDIYFILDIKKWELKQFEEEKEIPLSIKEELITKVEKIKNSIQKNNKENYPFFVQPKNPQLQQSFSKIWNMGIKKQ